MAVLQSQTVVPFDTALAGDAAVVFTKPTGLTVGDLMVCLVGGVTFVTNTGLAGWTELTTATHGVRLKTYYKYAEASDVSASNFSFACSAASPRVGGGTLYRFSDVVAGDPQFDSQTVSGPGNQTTVSAPISIDVVGNNATLIMGVYQSDNADSSNVGGYYITGGTNPTWTERNDYRLSSDDRTLAIADANYGAQDTDITAIGWTSIAGVSNQDGFLIMIPTKVDGSADIETVNAPLTPRGITAGVGGVSADITSIDILSTLNGVNTNNTSDQTMWSTKDKPLTDWTNPDK